jgi:small conductance mechanosensitive channel
VFDRRLDISDDDLAKGQQVLSQLVTDNARVRTDPAPLVFVNALGDSAVELALRFWVANADYWTLRREMTERAKGALEDAGLSIPFPQRDIHIRSSGDEPTMQLAQSA